MNREEVIAKLLNDGCKRTNSIKVKNVTVTDLQNYTRLGLTLDKPVKGMISKTKEDGTQIFEEGDVNIIFTSLFAVIALLKDDDDAAFAANHLLKHPEAMEVILSRATIDVISEPVTAGQQYVNPWSNSGKATVFDHDTFIPHVVTIKLADRAIRKLDVIADAMLGIK